MNMKKMSSLFLSFAVLAAQAAGSAPAWSQIERSAPDAEVLSVPGMPSGAGLGLPAALPGALDAQNFAALDPAGVDASLGQAASALAAPASIQAALPSAQALSVSAHAFVPPQAAVQSPAPSALSAATAQKTVAQAIAPASAKPAPGRSLLARLTRLAAQKSPFSAKTLGRLFDFSGSAAQAPRAFAAAAFAPPSIKPLPAPRLPKGVSLDLPPIVPDIRHLPAAALNLVSAFSIPDTEVINQLTNIPLEADGRDARSVEQALRQMIDDNPQYGVKSADLATAYVHSITGENQAPSWVVSFRQQRKSVAENGAASFLPVYGGNATFIIHVEDGKPVIKGVHGRLFPNLTVDTVQKVSAEDMVMGIQRRLRMTAAAIAPQIDLLERQIVYLQKPRSSAGLLDKIMGVFARKPKNGSAAKEAPKLFGAWHAVNIYRVQGVDPFVAVDIASGQVFLWDMRLGAAARGSKKSSAEGVFEGRAPKTDADMTTPPKLSSIPLPFVTVTLPDGRKVAADDQGRVSVEVPEGGSVEVTARLDSKNLSIVNKDGKNIEVKAKLVAGKDGATVVFNPPEGALAHRRRTSGASRMLSDAIDLIYGTASSDYKAKTAARRRKANEEDLALAQVTTYLAGYKFMEFNKAHGIGVKDGIWNSKFVINVNLDDNCNAYMDPSDLSRNFFQGGDGCINTGTLPGVVFHESGHLSHYLVAGYAPGQAASVLGSVMAAGSPAAHNIMPYVDGGLSEGIGDMFATYMENTPLIGQHFFDDPKQPFLRTAENDYQFSPSDEVHEQGLAWMGFTWKLRVLLAKALGATDGVALAENLLFPHLYGYATAQDIPTAMNVVYLAATALTGKTREIAIKAVQAAAAAHGIHIGPAKKKADEPGIAETFLPRRVPGAFPIPSPVYA
ncbi:MAG TPA: hypothetical protein VNH15_08325 [Elusimicrobiota bacterium]|nr:hypothetical protein [Elusimicrobiota bacterium]